MTMMDTEERRAAIAAHLEKHLSPPPPRAIKEMRKLSPAEPPLAPLVEDERTARFKADSKMPFPNMAKIEVALRLHMGNVTDAADALNVSPQVLRRKIRNSPNLRKIMQDIREEKLDLAEKKLLELIKGSNAQATTFFLRTQGKERGYTEKNLLEHEVGEKTLSAASLIEQMRKGGMDVDPDSGVIDVEGRLLEAKDEEAR